MRRWIALMTGLIMANVTGGACAHNIRHFSGLASYYSDDYSGKTANDDKYDPTQFTAAHATLPFGTYLRVSDSCNERSVTVVVNDRGPFVADRVLDLSMAAAKALSMVDRGTLRVIAVVQQVRAIHLRALLSGEPPVR